MNKEISKAIKFYALLLQLYPKHFEQHFRSEMIQTFKDHYTDVLETQGKVGLGFWLSVITDDLQGIVREQIIDMRRKRYVPIMILAAFCILVGSLILTTKVPPFITFTIPVIILLCVYVYLKSVTTSSARQRKIVKYVWLKDGLIYGLLLSMLMLPMNIVNILTIPHVPPLLYLAFAMLFMAGMPLLFAISGYTASQKSNETKQGVLAGLLSAIVAISILVVSTMIMMTVFWNIAYSNAFSDPGMLGDWHRGKETFAQFLWSDNLGAVEVMTMVMLVFGTILGTIGGLLGKQSTHIKPQNAW